MDYAIARERMVQNQLVARKITNEKVLEAMRTVPRHEFVPKELWGRAYGDHPLPIGQSQTISQPYMVALMTQQLQLEKTNKVLEIGTGSGYQAAILAELVRRVFSVERVPELSSRARKVLDGLGYGNVIIKTGDGTLGWKEFAPFDRIVVTAGAPDVPSALVEQLVDGGRIVLPIGNTYVQTLLVVKKKGKKIERKEVCGCTFVPLIGEQGWENG
ncbi:MAG: protein-L-isoaspartate(D-aspartate) O-methyltransferase [Gemmatimonadota bacterium]|nr:MAG: protein-L-isoaspartate(D-aspartate) O-methyltransferase [Gemmatimonadota bacterium]